MSAMTAAKLCGLAVIGGAALYTLKYSGGKKIKSVSFMEIAKDKQKAGDFSEDDLKRIESLVQKETDHFFGLVDEELKQKEEDLIEI